MTHSYPPARKVPGALNMMGLNLHSVDVASTHRLISEVIANRQKALVLNLNINCVNLALRHSWLSDFINQAQLVFCDGDGVRWGIKVLGMEPPPKITYDRWIWQLAEFAEQKGFSLYFLGAKPGIAEEAAQKLTDRFPSLRIVGVRDGYFEKTGPENEKIITEINRQKPDILIMGLGMPLQEKWLAENWLRLDAHIFLTGGAVFDYVSGRAKRAPVWMICLQMEWLFRFLQEPRRLFRRYVLGNPYFFYRIFLYRLKQRRGGK